MDGAVVARESDEDSLPEGDTSIVVADLTVEGASVRLEELEVFTPES